MKELICIVCPKGCHLTVDETMGNMPMGSLSVSGNSCEKGVDYARNELTNPTRMVTSTVVLHGGIHKRLPVKTTAPIPKHLVMEAVGLLDEVVVDSPVSCGAVVLKDILGIGVDFVATRTM